MYTRADVTTVHPPTAFEYLASPDSLQFLYLTDSYHTDSKQSIDTKMKYFGSIISASCLSLLTLPLTQAGPLASRASRPDPTIPFTVSAFESPYPIGQGITGLNLTARGGNLLLSPDPKGELSVTWRRATKTNCTSVKKAVLFVTGDGTAYLVHFHPSSVLEGTHFPIATH